MASGNNPKTRFLLHSEIAESPNGLDVEQLAQHTGLNPNTVKIYCRELARLNLIEIQRDTSRAGHSVIYVAVQPPKLELTAKEKLAAIAEILEPWTKHPQSWDKEVKGKMIDAIQAAVKMTC